MFVEFPLVYPKFPKVGCTVIQVIWWLYLEFTIYPNLQGMVALGVATVDSVTNAVATTLPFSPSQPSSMTDEDITNLRNLQRLLLLISGLQENENPSMVRESC